MTIDTRSQFEADIINDLQQRIEDDKALRDVDYGYETEYLKYYVEKKYLADLCLTTASGKKIYIEMKGYFSATDRGKMRKVKDANPDLDIRLVFQKNNRMYPKKKQINDNRYSDWCEKFGFQYAIGAIPDDWLRE